MRRCTSLGVRAPGELAFFDVEPPPLVDGDAAVRTLFSGLSAGTELTYVKGTDPAFTARRDPELGTFVPSEGGRRYPVVAMGYMEVAEVVERRRPDLAEGSLVGAAYGHRSCHVLGAADVVVPVPADVDPLLGIYLAQMGPICANGLLHAAAEFRGEGVASLGDGVRDRAVLVTGGGVVGLLTALFALHHGAREVALADPDPQRLAIAAALGVETVDERRTEPWRWCKERWVHGPGDRGADLVFPVSRPRRRPPRGPPEPPPAGGRHRPRLLPGRRAGAAPRRGVPPQRAHHPVRTGRPGPARAGR